MATATINLTGAGGLSTRHYEGTPQLTYNAGDAQLAGGIYNPFKKYGYLSPANNSITTVRGTGGLSSQEFYNEIRCCEYDSVNNDLIVTAKHEFFTLDGTADLSASLLLTLDTDRTILDTEIYEVGGERILAYTTDTSDIGDGMSIGFLGLDSESGLGIFDLDVVSAGVSYDKEYIGVGSTTAKMAQRFFGGDTNFEYKTFDTVRLRIRRPTTGTTYSVKVGIQRGSSVQPDGTFIAYGIVDDDNITTTNFEIDKFVTLNSSVTLDSGVFWIVVEIDSGTMTGVNILEWARTTNDNEIYGGATEYAGGAFVYESAAWGIASLTNETFDCGIVLSKTENWFPVKDDGYDIYTPLGTGQGFTDGNSGESFVLKYDSSHVAIIVQDNANDLKIQIYAISYITGAYTALGSALTVDTGSIFFNISAVMYDATHIAIAWQDSDETSDGKVQIIAVDTGYNCTVVGSALVYDSGSVYEKQMILLDSTHLAIAWNDHTNGDGEIRAFAVSGGYAVTAVGTQFEFESDIKEYVNFSIVKIDSTHVFLAWEGSDNLGYCRVLAVDGSYTWSFAGAEYQFDTRGSFSSSVLIDATHVLVSYSGDVVGGDNSGIKVKTLAIDGSYTITTVDTETIYSVASGYKHLISIGNNQYTLAWTGSNTDGFITTFDVNPTTYLITKHFPNYEYNTSKGYNLKLTFIDTGYIVITYGNGSSTILSILYTMDYEYNANNFYVEEGQNSFLRRADNGLLYWLTDKTVSSIDGSITGGNAGTFNRDILRFPSYTEIVDAVDARGYLNIAIHANTTSTGSTDTKKFTTNPCGVYIWDRLSTVVRTRDFITIEGAREIRKIFLSRSGDIMLITISNSGYCELRKLSNSKFVVVAKFELAGYPRYSDSITVIEDMVSWLGTNGIVYAWGSVEMGSPEALHKIGSLSGHSTGSYTSGVIVGAHTGTPVGTYVSWMDGTDEKLSKWYPSGDGTIDTIAQKGNIGNVYSSVKLLPQMSTINHINVYNLPIATNDSTDMGDIKIYFNQSTTPWATKQVTKKDLYKGVYFIPVGKSYINSIQIEIEWDVAVTLGADMWNPIFAEIDYTPTKTINKK